MFFSALCRPVSKRKNDTVERPYPFATLFTSGTCTSLSGLVCLPAFLLFVGSSCRLPSLIHTKIKYLDF